MLKKHNILLIIITSSLFLILNGCIIKKDFEFTIEEIFVISESNSTTFSKYKDINATDINSNFNKYKEDISNIEIKDASYYNKLCR